MTSSVRKGDVEGAALEETAASSNSGAMTGQGVVHAVADSSAATRRKCDGFLAAAIAGAPSAPSPSPTHAASDTTTRRGETNASGPSGSRRTKTKLRICSSVSPRSNSRSRTPPCRGLRIVASASPERSLPHASQQSWVEDVGTPTVDVEDAT